VALPANTSSFRVRVNTDPQGASGPGMYVKLYFQGVSSSGKPFYVPRI
jgi:hypothetical protein